MELPREASQIDALQWMCREAVRRSRRHLDGGSQDFNFMKMVLGFIRIACRLDWNV
jgi:hypothetical protein